MTAVGPELDALLRRLSLAAAGDAAQHRPQRRRQRRLPTRLRQRTHLPPIQIQTCQATRSAFRPRFAHPSALLAMISRARSLTARHRREVQLPQPWQRRTDPQPVLLHAFRAAVHALQRVEVDRIVLQRNPKRFT